MSLIIQFPLRRIVLYTSARQSAQRPPSSASFIYRPRLSTSSRSQSETHGREKTRRVNKHALKQSVLPSTGRGFAFNSLNTPSHQNLDESPLQTLKISVNCGQVQPQALLTYFYPRVGPFQHRVLTLIRRLGSFTPPLATSESGTRELHPGPACI